MYQRKKLCKNKKHGYEYYVDSFKKLKSIFEEKNKKLAALCCTFMENES